MSIVHKFTQATISCTVAPSIYELPVWTLLYCHPLVSKIWRCFPHFWKMCDLEVYRIEVWYREVPGLNFTLIYPHFRGFLHLRQTYSGFLFQIKLGPSPSKRHPRKICYYYPNVDVILS